jgi:putative acetyltransferase
MLLINTLDAYLLGKCPPEYTHLLDIDTLPRPEVTFVIARVEGAAVGCGAMRQHDHDFIEIKRMTVRPHARGHRVGAGVLRLLEQLGRNESFPLARLETVARQPEALRLYERAAYRRVGPFGGQAESGPSIFPERAL